MEKAIVNAGLNHYKYWFIVKSEKVLREKQGEIPYSRESGWRVKLPWPEDFFSNIFAPRLPSSCPPPDRVLRKQVPRFRRKISFTRWLESRGKSRTNELSRVEPVTRSKI